MGINGIIDLAATFISNFASTAAAKPSPLVMKAPQQLDVSQVQSWLTGSVMGLLALNLVALGFYLMSLFAPQLAKLAKALQSFLVAMKTPKATAAVTAPSLDFKPAAPPSDKTEKITEVTEVAQPAASQIQESVQLPTPEETTPTVQEEIQLPSNEPSSPPAAEAAAPPEAPALPPDQVQASLEEALKQPEPAQATEIKEEVQLPPPDSGDDVSKALSEALMGGIEPETPPPAPEFEPPTVVLDNPVADEAPSAPDVTEIMTKEEKKSTSAASPSLPVESDSGMKESTAMFEQGLKSIEESLNEALTTSSNQDELSIFDPTSIDKVLREEEKK